MALTKLGNYIEETDVRNSELSFSSANLKGISINKVLIPTKANTNDLDLRNYKILRNNEFVFCTVTSRNGKKISLAYNNGPDCIISSINPTFKIKDESKLLPRFLMMFFNRSEFDRYARYNSWGSARETFTWENMCDIELNLPSIEIQRKYVSLYEGLLANLRSYESGLENLKLVCSEYIENLKKKYSSNLFGKLYQCDTRNSSCQATRKMGISIDKVFIPTKSASENIKKQKVVFPNQFAFVPTTSRNGNKISIAFNDSNENFAVSSTYVVFSCDESINPKYLNLWFKRDEFNRFARFNSWGSVREAISLEDIESYKIGLPPRELQDLIVDVFDVYSERKEYANRLKKIINGICPLLVIGAVKEANKAN